MLNNYFFKHVYDKAEGDKELMFALLVDCIAKGNAAYISELIREYRTGDMMGLVNYIGRIIESRRTQRSG